MRVLEAEQVESGEHATDDIVARRGGAHACADGRRDARAELAGMSLPGEAGELLRAFAEASGPERRVRQAAIELGALGLGDPGAPYRGDAQVDRGRGVVPCAQVDCRRGGDELGPAGEDRRQGDPIGHADSTRCQAGRAGGDRDERAGRGGENRCCLSDIDDGERIDIRPLGQRTIATKFSRRGWTVCLHE